MRSLDHGYKGNRAMMAVSLEAMGSLNPER